MICKCGGKEFFLEEHGNHTGIYCSACGKWQKWFGKDEIRLFNHGTIPSHNVAIQIEGFQNTSLLERLKARIAEYVRSRYPEIEKTFDFAAYSIGVTLKEEFGRHINEVFGGTGKEVDDVCDSESEDR